MTRVKPQIQLAAAIMLTVATLVAGCSRGDNSSGASEAVTVTSCGRDITINDIPERVVITKSDPISLLLAVGAADKVVARSGFIPVGYPQEYRAALEDIPTISDAIDGTGHSIISTEELLAQRPDLVIGAPSTVDVEALASSGIPVYTPKEYCDSSDNATPPQASFERITAELDTYGRIFRAQPQADTAIDRINGDIDSIPHTQKPLRAAALYVTPGADTVYSYGTSSMLDPIIRSTGMTQVFDDVSRRVGEVSVEQLVARAPDVLILAFDSATQVDVAAAFRETTMYRTLEQSRPADAADLLLVPVDFQLTDPPSPATLIGAHRIGEAVAGPTP